MRRAREPLRAHARAGRASLRTAARLPCFRARFWNVRRVHRRSFPAANRPFPEPGGSLDALADWRSVETSTKRRILDGRWALTEPVGGGGMSQVYRGLDLEQEHGEVAVK